MYAIIHNHPDPRQVYCDKLMHLNEVNRELAKELEESFWADLQARLDMVKQKPLPYEYQEPEQAWRSLKKTTDPKDFEESPKTGITAKKFD